VDAAPVPTPVEAAPPAPAPVPEVPVVPVESAPAPVSEDALLLEIFKARDSGNLSAAKAKAEELLKQFPNSQAGKEELDKINAAIAAAPAPALAPVAPPAPPPPATPLEAAVRKNESLYREVERLPEDVLKLVNARQYDEAIRLVDAALEELPDNAASVKHKENLNLLRQQIIGVRAGGGNIGPTADVVMGDTVQLNKRYAEEAMALLGEARKQIKRNQLDAAEATLESAVKKLPQNIAFEDKAKKIRETKANLLYVRWSQAVDARDLDKAQKYVDDFATLTGKDSRDYLRLMEEFERVKSDPKFRPISVSNPAFPITEAKIKDLMLNAKSRYLYGDYEGASALFKEVLLYAPNNAEAKAHILHINNILAASGSQNRELTKAGMLQDVDNSWVFPSIFNKDAGAKEAKEDPLVARLRQTNIPAVFFRDALLSDALKTLRELSRDYDPRQEGFNIVSLDPDNKNPRVSLAVQNMSLDRILDYVVKSANSNWFVNNGVIEIRPDVGSSDVDTETFSISSQALLRMTGVPAATTGSGGGNQAAGGDYATAGATASIAPVPENSTENAIKNFFQKNGVLFQEGHGLAFEGSKISVTQNRRNLEKIRRILERLNDVKQVNIAAKFIEVSQIALKQISSNFIVQKDSLNGTTVRASTGLRQLQDVYGEKATGSQGVIRTAMSTTDPETGLITTSDISETTFSGGMPKFGNSSLGMNRSVPLFEGIVGSIGSWDLKLLIDAIEGNQGSDLMASPNVTVITGQEATIKIVQELLYPEKYSQGQMQQPQVNNSSWGNTSSSSASVSFLSGSPEEFKSRDIGVTFRVKPEFREDSSMIDLELHPQVTEFEGFVEYGGPSVAVAGTTTIVAPSGFYQPIFAVRQVDTFISIADGATAIIGGLTREEVKTVEDKIPVLGDIPIIGAAFRSKGRNSSKRNLMIFVTANMVTPNGALRRPVAGVAPGSTYANPTILTPGGSVREQVTDSSLAAPKTATSTAESAVVPVPVAAPAAR
jgi:general secretion pathway protein D